MQPRRTIHILVVLFAAVLIVYLVALKKEFLESR